jgi:hypothetical protein
MAYLMFMNTLNYAFGMCMLFELQKERSNFFWVVVPRI